MRANYPVTYSYGITENPLYYQIPAIAYGTWSTKFKGKDFHEYIELALNTGFCHIDTAQCDFSNLIFKSFKLNLSFVTKGTKMKKASL